MTVETSLQYELTPFPLSLFSNKDQKMNKANKADFSKTSLKALTDPLDLTNQPCSGWSSFKRRVFTIHFQSIFGMVHYAMYNYIVLFWVRANDADVLVMLVHHSSGSHHPLFLTTSNGSYDVQKIKESLSERQKDYLLFCHAFTGCDTVSSIAGHGKTTLFDR